jgi:hypothetical protein
MAYIPDWERLSDALKRVMAAGYSKSRAQLDICHAIADRKIRIRYLISKEEIGGTTVPKGQGIAGHVIWRLDVIPLRLTPSDFDWRKSRPKMPWQVWPNPVLWHLDWVELLSADVTRALIAGGDDSRGSPKEQLKKTRQQTFAGKASRSDRHRPARALAEKALAVLFRGELPDRIKIADQKVCGEVQDWLRKNSDRQVSSDTILRAAGRR